jgi:hypothetical protein
LLPKSLYAQQQPTGFVAVCFLGFVDAAGCWWCVQDATTSLELGLRRLFWVCLLLFVGCCRFEKRVFGVSVCF